MYLRDWLRVSLIAILMVIISLSSPAPACCPAPPFGKPVVNADQTVILIWDAEKKVFQNRPCHDWTSHAADSARYLALAIDGSSAGESFSRKIVYPRQWIA